MKDLKHLIYFENLLENADNELVRKAQEDGGIALGYTCYHVPGVEILSYIPADSEFAANDIRGRSVMELPEDSNVITGVKEALRKIEIL